MVVMDKEIEVRNRRKGENVEGKLRDTMVVLKRVLNVVGEF